MCYAYTWLVSPSRTSECGELWDHLNQDVARHRETSHLLPNPLELSQTQRTPIL
jgi:hypothetical protein